MFVFGDPDPLVSLEMACRRQLMLISLLAQRRSLRHHDNIYLLNSIAVMIEPMPA